MPNGAAGLYLLGHVRELQSSTEEAVKNYREALRLDPTLWCAFERLCCLKPDEVDSSQYFTANHPLIMHLNMAISDGVRQQKTFVDTRLNLQSTAPLVGSPQILSNNFMVGLSKTTEPLINPV